MSRKVIPQYPMKRVSPSNPSKKAPLKARSKLQTTMSKATSKPRYDDASFLYETLGPTGTRQARLSPKHVSNSNTLNHYDEDEVELTDDEEPEPRQSPSRLSPPKRRTTIVQEAEEPIEKRQGRTRVLFTPEQSAAVSDGLEKYGPAWTFIKRKYDVLSNKTGQQLKDHARALRNRESRE